MEKDCLAEQLKLLRAQISNLDEQLLSLFAQRMEVVEQVAEYKKKSGAPVLDPQREAELLAGVEGQDRVFMETLLRLSRERQYELLLDSLLAANKWPLGADLENASSTLPRVRQVAVVDTQLTPGCAAAAKLFPTVPVVPLNSAAAAVRQVIDRKADAAILPLTGCRQVAGEIYSLLVDNSLYIQAALAPQTKEQPSFIAVGKKLILPPQAGRVSLLLQMPRQSSALAAATNIFADLGINLDEIEPIATAQQGAQFRFCFSFWALRASGEVRRVLYQLEREFPHLSLLGWYVVEKVMESGASPGTPGR